MCPFASFLNVKLHKPAKFHDGIIFSTIVVITDRTRVENVGCYAVIRLTQKGNPRKMCHSRTKKFDSRTKKFDPRKIDYPRKKFQPRKVTHAKLSPKKTHDPRKFTHIPRPTTHDPRPTTHDPRSFSNPRNPYNLALSSTRHQKTKLRSFLSYPYKISLQRLHSTTG